MAAKVMKTDANVLLDISDTFGQVLSDYFCRLPSHVSRVGGTVMDQAWCHPGRTGILRLLLCLYWQAEYSGTGPDWDSNIKHVENIFNAILEHPDLSVDFISSFRAGILICVGSEQSAEAFLVRRLWALQGSIVGFESTSHFHHNATISEQYISLETESHFG
jgi:hypothetical protein